MLVTDKKFPFQVRLSLDDINKLRVLAVKSKLSASEWVRRAIQNGKP